MTPLDRITLKGMRFHALIGTFPHEALVQQPLEIDVTVEVIAAPATGVVDYALVYDAVESIVTARHVPYLEELAEQVAVRMLSVDRVSTVHVAVRKPHVALPGPLAYAEVAITRTRLA